LGEERYLLNPKKKPERSPITILAANDASLKSVKNDTDSPLRGKVLRNRYRYRSLTPLRPAQGLW
jgi:hypothetical protein